MVKFVEQMVFFKVTTLNDFVEWSRHLRTNSKMYVRENNTLKAYAFTSPIPISLEMDGKKNDLNAIEKILVENGFVHGEFVAEELGG